MVEMSQYKSSETSSHEHTHNSVLADAQKPGRNVVVRILRTLGLFVTVVAVALLLGGSAYPQSVPRVSGSVFGDYYYNIENHLPAEKDMQTFDYRRIYIGAQDSIVPKATGRLRVEVKPIGGASADNRILLDVKDAYLEIQEMHMETQAQIRFKTRRLSSLQGSITAIRKAFMLYRTLCIRHMVYRVTAWTLQQGQRSI